MAEFLLLARDPPSPPADVTKRDRMYRRGDIIVVMPDGHVWGKEERLPIFVVVKIPGVSVAAATKYIEPYYVGTGIYDDNGSEILRVVQRRKWHVLVDNVPNSIKNALRDNGEVTVTWNQIRTYVHNKLTLTTE